MTVRGHSDMVCNQPLRLTQASTLSAMENEYRSKGKGNALRLGR